MAGTKEGGKKAAAKNEAREPGFYARIGGKGGRNGNTGGFAAYVPCNGKCGLDHILGMDHTIAQCAGYKGGMKSRRKYVKKES
jgi:general stress protein YciG